MLRMLVEQHTQLLFRQLTLRATIKDNNSAKPKHHAPRPILLVMWQAVTRKCQDGYQHKLEHRSRNTSVLWQTVTRNCQDGYRVPVTKRLGIVADGYPQLSGRLPT